VGSEMCIRDSDYKLVYFIKQTFPHLYIGINGGIKNMKNWAEHLEHVDEIMVGRSAYQTPEILTYVDDMVYNQDKTIIDYDYIIQSMVDYCEQQKYFGVKFYHIIRHMLGLFHGKPNSKVWRRILTEKGTQETATSAILLEAYHEFKQKNNTA
jgi:tRNA-dihydrouridine synthase A